MSEVPLYLSHETNETETETEKQCIGNQPQTRVWVGCIGVPLASNAPKASDEGTPRKAKRARAARSPGAS